MSATAPTNEEISEMTGLPVDEVEAARQAVTKAKLAATILCMAAATSPIETQQKVADMTEGAAQAGELQLLVVGFIGLAQDLSNEVTSLRNQLAERG